LDWEYWLFTPKAIDDGLYYGKLIVVAALTERARRENMASILAVIDANIITYWCAQFAA
jgi:hypothetical protein